jgi:uncharacterized membrane protein
MKQTLLIHSLQAGVVILLLQFALPLLMQGKASIGWWLMQSLPLLLILPRLHKKEPRPLQWLGFLVLFYFTVGVLQVSGTDNLLRWSGAVVVLCCCLLFALAIVRLRTMRHHQE